MRRHILAEPCLSRIVVGDFANSFRHTGNVLLGHGFVDAQADAGLQNGFGFGRSMLVIVHFR